MKAKKIVKDIRDDLEARTVVRRDLITAIASLELVKLLAAIKSAGSKGIKPDNSDLMKAKDLAKLITDVKQKLESSLNALKYPKSDADLAPMTSAIAAAEPVSIVLFSINLLRNRINMSYSKFLVVFVVVCF